MHTRILNVGMELMAERIDALAKQRGYANEVMLQIIARSGIPGKTSKTQSLNNDELAILLDFIRKSPAQVKRLKDLHAKEGYHKAIRPLMLPESLTKNQTVSTKPMRGFPKIALNTLQENGDENGNLQLPQSDDASGANRHDQNSIPGKLNTENQNANKEKFIIQLKTMPSIEIDIVEDDHCDSPSDDQSSQFNHIYGFVVMNYSRIHARLKKLFDIKKNKSIPASKMKKQLPPSTFNLIKQMTEIRNLFAHEIVNDVEKMQQKFEEFKRVVKAVDADLTWIAKNIDVR